LLRISEDRDKHIELLRKFLAILPFILPSDKGAISRPTLWHLDVHEGNVFVDHQDPTKITSIIDWQNVWAAPLFMQARFLGLADCPHEYPEGAVMPALPEDFHTLSEDEQKFEKQVLLDLKLKKYYKIATRRLILWFTRRWQ
jgi:aminoglycoside phosphotransferase (APT) family kinase protein